VVKPRTPKEAEHLLRVESQILDELNVKGLQLLTDSSTDGELHQRALEAARSTSRASEAPEASQVEAIVPVDGYWVSLEGGYMVAMDTTITPELAEEGLARELVHRLQNLRRAAGFEITDRIVTYYQGPDSVREVMRKFADYVCQETLSEALHDEEPEAGATAESQKIEGTEVVLGVKRI
jgi:isoleucyl-tRNA synthetase